MVDQRPLPITGQGYRLSPLLTWVEPGVRERRVPRLQDAEPPAERLGLLCRSVCPLLAISLQQGTWQADGA